MNEVSFWLSITNDRHIANVCYCLKAAVSGTDESLRLAREWIQENASDLGAGAPAVSEGSVLLQLS